MRVAKVTGETWYLSVLEGESLRTRGSQKKSHKSINVIGFDLVGNPF